MKKSLFISCLIAMLMVSCGTKEETWEYKVVKVAGKDAERLWQTTDLLFMAIKQQCSKNGQGRMGTSKYIY